MISLLDLTPLQVFTYHRQILLSIMYILFVIIVIHINAIKNLIHINAKKVQKHIFKFYLENKKT